MIAANLKEAQEEIALWSNKNAILKGEVTKAQARVIELEEKLKILKGVSKGLTISEAIAERTETLKAENKTLKEAKDKFLAELKTHCEKLCIQVNGQQHHNSALFVKEIAALSADEIKSRLTLPWQKGTGKPKPSAASRRRVLME